MACYIHDEICDIPTVFNYGLDPDLIAANIVLPERDSQRLVVEMETLDLEGAAGRGSMRSDYYICSYSFAKYLIETYGMDTFMSLYSAADESEYLSLTGSSLAELQLCWRKSAEMLAGEMNEAEYLEYFDGLAAAHGLGAD